MGHLIAYLKWPAPFGLWLAITIHDSINIFTLLFGLIGILGAIGVLSYGAKWKAAFQSEQAVVTAQKDRIEQLLVDAQQGREHEQQLVALLNEQKSVIAVLEARPSYEQVVQLIGELAVKEDAAAVNRAERSVRDLIAAFSRVMAEHEAKDEKRFGDILDRLKAIQRGVTP